jgi:signal transduction histidine kinase
LADNGLDPEATSTLPAREVSDDGGPPMSVLDPSERDRAFLKGLRVLYVEDDEDVRELLAVFLRRRVASVVVAEDGAAGLEAFGRERPDLIVTDIQMPRMDGLAMSEVVRRLAPSIPIVITTAFEQPSYLLRAIDLGVDKYVTKPVDSDRMQSALLAVARQLRAEVALEAQHRAALAEARSMHLEAIGLLAGGMAHDFNNLLQIVLLNLELAADFMPIASEGSELLASAQASAAAASALSRRLVDLANGGIVEREPVRLEAFVGLALRRALVATGVKLELDFEAGLPALGLDQRLFARALEHLARNASEAMPGGGTLTVRARRRAIGVEDGLGEGPGECVELSFRDAGPGIAADLLPRVFEPYFSSKPRGTEKGMGMGLALCRAIVRKHGGVVGARSPDGGGALVTILLPVSSGASPEGAPHAND